MGLVLGMGIVSIFENLFLVRLILNVMYWKLWSADNGTETQLKKFLNINKNWKLTKIKPEPALKQKFFYQVYIYNYANDIQHIFITEILIRITNLAEFKAHISVTPFHMR